jgi:mxaA protein
MKRGTSCAAWVAMFCAAAAASGAGSPPGPQATVEQPRAFGYVIGDIVTQRVLLEQQGHSFAPVSLPAPGSLGNWVERHASRIERDTGGHRWLVVEYQIMNSPEMLMLVTLPAWKVKEKSTTGVLEIPEWQISVGPLTPEKPLDQSGLGVLRPDHSAALIDVAPRRRWIETWTGGAVGLTLAWLGWWGWRNWRAASSLPFAKALRELRGLDEQAPEAWYSLHRALDATAGRVIQRDTVSVLFERAPQLAAQRVAIERFLDASVARFFDVRADQPAQSPSFSLRDLCADLRRIEKRYET